MTFGAGCFSPRPRVSPCSRRDACKGGCQMWQSATRSGKPRARRCIRGLLGPSLILLPLTVALAHCPPAPAPSSPLSSVAPPGAGRLADDGWQRSAITVSGGTLALHGIDMATRTWAERPRLKWCSVRGSRRADRGRGADVGSGDGRRAARSPRCRGLRGCAERQGRGHHAGVLLRGRAADHAHVRRLRGRDPARPGFPPSNGSHPPVAAWLRMMPGASGQDDPIVPRRPAEPTV